MGKIVYHGTWSPNPPHKYGEQFHAGTEQAAKDRLFSEENIPKGYGHFQVMHAYEIPENLISKKMRSDPDAGDTYHQVWGNNPLVDLPERPQVITPYLNDHEDRGSTSYVIPSRFVQSGMVKHLGAQWDIDPNDSRNGPIVNAASVMVGGKHDPNKDLDDLDDLDFY